MSSTFTACLGYFRVNVNGTSSLCVKCVFAVVIQSSSFLSFQTKVDAIADVDKERKRRLTNQTPDRHGLRRHAEHPTIS